MGLPSCSSSCPRRQVASAGAGSRWSGSRRAATWFLPIPALPSDAADSGSRRRTTDGASGGAAPAAAPHKGGSAAGSELSSSSLQDAERVGLREADYRQQHIQRLSFMPWLYYNALKKPGQQWVRRWQAGLQARLMALETVVLGADCFIAPQAHIFAEPGRTASARLPV